SSKPLLPRVGPHEYPTRLKARQLLLGATQGKDLHAFDIELDAVEPLPLRAKEPQPETEGNLAPEAKRAMRSLTANMAASGKTTSASQRASSTPRKTSSILVRSGVGK